MSKKFFSTTSILLIVFVSSLLGILLLLFLLNYNNYPKTILLGNLPDTGSSDLKLRVFSTSTRYSGNLVQEAINLNLEFDKESTQKGLAAGDAICTYHAQNAGLEGEWAAWLSQQGINAKDRVELQASYGRYFENNIVANTKSSLFSGYIRLPVSVTESKNISDNYLVWTGSNANGNLIERNNCNNWSSANTNIRGIVGNSFADDPTWLGGTQIGDNNLRNCSERRKLYCVDDDPNSDSSYIFVTEKSFTGNLIAEAGHSCTQDTGSCQCDLSSVMENQCNTGFTATCTSQVSCACRQNDCAMVAADKLCQQAASTASLSGNNWKAIISNDFINAKDRITVSDRQFKLIVGANDFVTHISNLSQLLDGNIDSYFPISLNEFNKQSPSDDSFSFRVFTGTNSKGEFTSRTCNNWQSNSETYRYTFGFNKEKITENIWTEYEGFGTCNVNTNNLATLYCFQQKPPVNCGPLDFNDDKYATIIDLNNLARRYNPNPSQMPEMTCDKFRF
jgi:hypothetical protein